MANEQIYYGRIFHKRDSSANFTANDPVIGNGEMIIVDTKSGEVRKKIGDGVKKYSQLPFDDEYLRALIDGTDTSSVYTKDVMSSEWVLNETTGIYDITIPETEHNCGTNAYVVNVSAIENDLRDTILNNSSIVTNTGNITVSVSEPVDSRIVIMGNIQNITTGKANMYLKEVVESDWVYDDTNEVYNCFVGFEEHNCGQQAFILNVTQLNNGNYETVLYNQKIGADGSITVEISEPIAGRILISGTLVDFVDNSQGLELSALSETVNQHINDKENPHEVTVEQIGAVPVSRTINTKPLTGNVTLSASDLNAVPVTTTINNKALSSNITLSASDVGAQKTITGGASTITDTNLTASRALVSDSNGKVAVSTVTAAQLGYLSDATSSIQTQLNNKVGVVSGKQLSTNDYTTTEKNKLAGIATGAEVNQNAFSNVVVGSTTISADAKQDTLTLTAGTNITLTPDATNDKVTIAAKDTTYSNFVKSGSSAAAGLVPAPSTTAGTTKYLREDGTWQVPPDTNTTYGVATTSANGLMTAAMVTKLNGIATNANNYTYTLPTATTTTLGGVKSGSSVTSTTGLTACPIISGVPYYKDTNTTYSTTSSVTSGSTALITSGGVYTALGSVTSNTPATSTVTNGSVTKVGKVGILQLYFTTSSVTATGATISTLPSGYRPMATAYGSVGGGTGVGIQITTAGVVTNRHNLQTGTWYGCIVFPIGN